MYMGGRFTIAPMDTNICCIKECENKATHVGMCKGHWNNMKEFGSPIRAHKSQFHGLELLDRLMKRVEKMETGCWHYTGSKDIRGYGRISVAGKPKLATRIVWEQTNGEIPRGKYVCHRCDNPQCVNPAHLFIGSQQDNVDDMWAKGRAKPDGVAQPPRVNR